MPTFFFFSSRRRHTRWNCDWSSDVCSSDLSDDLPAVIAAGADALVIPKVNSAGEIRAVDDQVARTEVERGRPPGSVRLLPLIETALGVLNAYAIATACPRVDALVLGHVDLSLSLGIREAGLRQGTILHARCQVVLAARA